MSKSMQASSYSTETRNINTYYSFYDWHFNQPFYVDKTLLIKELLYDNHAVIHAPPGFGKTLNMDMVRRFFEVEVDKDGKRIEFDVDEDKRCLKEVQTRSKNFKLFEGKKIFEDKQFVFMNFGKYPTIHVDFNELVGFNYEEMLVQFRKILNEAFRQHAYLENSSLWDRPEFNKKIFMKYINPAECASLNELDMENGLNILAKFLHGYFGEAVYMFIDNLDAPVNSLVYQNVMTPEDEEKTIEFLQDTICQLLKRNKYVERSLSNSCLKFSRLILKDARNVAHYTFMNEECIREFYGLEETELKYLLEKAGRLEDFDKIKENYEGYKTKSSDYHNIEIYHTWVIMNFLKTGRFDVYLSSGILHKIKELICHARVRPKIAQIMSEEFIKIKYDNCEWLENSDIETLSNILCDCKIIEYEDADLFIRFATEQGFFHTAEKDDSYLSLSIRNRKVYSIIDEIMGSIDWMNKYFNHSPGLIDNFNESLRDLAQLRNLNAVSALAESINVLFRSGRTIKTTYELQSALHAYMLQKFKYASNEYRTSLRTRCDTLLVIADLHVMFIIEYKAFCSESDVSHREIWDKRYDTLINKELIENRFPKRTPRVESMIYLKIHMNKIGETSITYSFNNMKPNTVVSKGALN